LRDDRGHYGWSVTAFGKDADDRTDDPVRLLQLTTWDLSIIAAGALVQDLDVAPPRDIGTLVFGAVLSATRAFGSTDLSTTVTCPPVQPGGAVACRAAGRAHTATLRRLDQTHFRLNVQFAVP
jgi:hypothetical protein